MSCYICDKKTLETVLKAQVSCRDIKCRNDQELEGLWRDVVRSNYEAYSYRYDEPIPEDLDEQYPVPFTAIEFFLNDKPNKKERYEALKEYMYQCAEGDYYKRPGYYKSQWCLDEMLEDYIKEEFEEK